jgi:hypothetical protein
LSPEYSFFNVNSIPNPQLATIPCKGNSSQ